MQDCGHATPIENASPAGKAQKLVKRTNGETNDAQIWWIPVKTGVLDGFDGTWNVWFQVVSTVGALAIFTMRPMELSERQRKYLRGLGHALKPVLLIGNAGITPAVITEAKRALHDHELIKVKFRGADREARDVGLAAIAGSTDSVLVHRIGHTALYYKRRNDRPGIVIPDA